jgi:glutamate/tyrosine decarboxylase-like PLP-dependent enzyme
MISDNIRLSRAMYECIAENPELEALSQGLSITTFRYVPPDLHRMDNNFADYLNDLNRELLTLLQRGGKAYLSNAIIGGKYALRACIVNFRTTLQDVKELLPLVVRLGKDLDGEMRRQSEP